MSRLLYGFERYVFFFFKQKTAYEMRISDWSSDVCSSDLDASARVRFRPIWRFQSLCAWLWHHAGHQPHLRGPYSRGPDVVPGYRWIGQSRPGDAGHIGELSCRQFSPPLSHPTSPAALDSVPDPRL